jgi:hypothetical protein
LAGCFFLQLLANAPVFHLLLGCHDHSGRCFGNVAERGLYQAWLNQSIEIVIGNHARSTANSYTSAGGTNSHADSYGDSGLNRCPICGAHGMLRIRRRPIDRILSLFVRLRRFRCTHVECHWEGNLRAHAPDRRRPEPTE